jgi:hypothetical protein
MENIFEKLIIPNHFSNKIFLLKDLKKDLYFYLNNNLDNENFNLLKMDLQNALTTNANGEYFSGLYNNTLPI